MKHLERHRILTSLYHGFRSGYACETQLLVTLHDCMKAYDAGLTYNFNLICKWIIVDSQQYIN